MYRTQSGDEVVFAGSGRGKVIICYGDGRRVETTWQRLRMVNELISSLRDAYVLLLDRCNREPSGAPLPLEQLIRMDSVLHAIIAPDTGAESTDPGPAKASFSRISGVKCCTPPVSG